MALDGKHFFYVNPLEVHPKTLAFNHIYDHVKPVRQRWFGCACCPPNIARVLTSLGHYIYTVRQDALFINLYVGNDVAIPVGDETLALRISGNYPWHEQVKIDITSPVPVTHTLALRLPDWCAAPDVLLNGEAVTGEISRGYLYLTRSWQEGDVITLTLPMPVRRVYGNPQVRQQAGKVALQRGPLVYCLEEADNGANLHHLSLPENSEFRIFEGKGIFAHKMLIQAEGIGCHVKDTDALWQYDRSPVQRQPRTLTFIPWFSWANREKGKCGYGWMKAEYLRSVALTPTLSHGRGRTLRQHATCCLSQKCASITELRMLADKRINFYQQTSRHRDVDTLGPAVELFHINIYQQPLPACEILRTTFQMRFHITRKRQCIIHFK
jgi:DUF1680 family protein